MIFYELLIIFILQKVLSIRRLLLAQYSAFPVNGLVLYKKTLEACAVLSTGCSNIDALLDDGIYTSEVTEIVGVSVSGKTQVKICFSCPHFSELLKNNKFKYTSLKKVICTLPKI